MPITIHEKLLTLADAAKLVPRRKGRKPHLSSMYRWTTTGCRGIVLESIQCGATRCASREALERFFARLTDDAGLRRSGVSAETDRYADDVDRSLSTHGF